jgi:hypothetical protein
MSSREQLHEALSKLLYQHRHLELHQIQHASPDTKYAGPWLELYIGGAHECLREPSRKILNTEVNNILALLDDLGVLDIGDETP